jgi:ribosomal protein L37E
MEFNNFLGKLNEGRRRSSDEPKGECPECGAPIYGDEGDVCPECDALIKYQGSCPRCGQNIYGEETDVCPNCGFDPSEDDEDEEEE